MKKILVCLLLLCSVSLSYASDKHEIKYKGQKYVLKYSVKSVEHSGYFNEYYKPAEGYTTWTEMLAVHHFPNAYSPIEHAIAFRDYLDSINCPSILNHDDKNNTAELDFILISSKRLPIIMEFNVFNFEKDKVSGTIALQYVKRYSVTNTMDVEAVKKEFEKNRKKMVKYAISYKIPQIINDNYDNGVKVVVTNNNKNEEIIENEQLTSKVKAKEDDIVNDAESVVKTDTCELQNDLQHANISEKKDINICPDDESYKNDTHTEIYATSNQIKINDDSTDKSYKMTEDTNLIDNDKKCKSREINDKTVKEKKVKEDKVSEKKVKEKKVKEDKVGEKKVKEKKVKEDKVSEKKVKEKKVKEKNVNKKSDKTQKTNLKKQKDIDKLEKEIMKLNSSLQDIMTELESIKSK